MGVMCSGVMYRSEDHQFRCFAINSHLLPFAIYSDVPRLSETILCCIGKALCHRLQANSKGLQEPPERYMIIIRHIAPGNQCHSIHKERIHGYCQLIMPRWRGWCHYIQTSRPCKGQHDNRYIAIEQEVIFPHMAYIKISSVKKVIFYRWCLFLLRAEMSDGIIGLCYLSKNWGIFRLDISCANARKCAAVKVGLGVVWLGNIIG
jgi:hypothetical protein